MARKRVKCSFDIKGINIPITKGHCIIFCLRYTNSQLGDGSSMNGSKNFEIRLIVVKD